jgi:hypothetical protein
MAAQAWRTIDVCGDESGIRRDDIEIGAASDSMQMKGLPA